MNRPLRAAALLLVASFSLQGVSAAATGDERASELGPTRLGLPGLAATIVTPGPATAPLRLGVYFETGTIDPTHGLSTGGIDSTATSRALRLQLGIRASESVMISASAPLRWYDVRGVDGASASGLGDVELGAAARMLEAGRVRTGVWGRLRLPTGDEGKGLSTGEVEGEVGLLSSTSFFTGAGSAAPEMHWMLNVGMRFNKNEARGYGILDRGDPTRSGIFPPSYPAVGSGANHRDNDQVLLRTAVEFRRRWAHLFLEASVDWLPWYDGASFQESASWFTPGIYVGKDDGLGLKAAWSIGLWADDASTPYVPQLPDWTFEAGLSYPIFLGGRDRDGDGIEDGKDQCPDAPEDIDGYQDEDGCPDPDNDGDGIVDRYDLAPNLPEDMDGFQDDDGRPDLDNDLDGIPDDKDQCPNQPEDFDGFQDQDGCPDVVLDSDGDGIEDRSDACPNQPEDKDGFEDEDGCPDPDNDLDGIPDTEDQCPNQAEDYNGIDDTDGCPDMASAPFDSLHLVPGRPQPVKAKFP